MPELGSAPRHRRRCLTPSGRDVAIVAGVYVCALVVPAVEKVWALCGSSVCIAVAFILPTSYYLEVRAAKYAPLRMGAARVVLVAAVAMALVCTGIQVL